VFADEYFAKLMDYPVTNMLEGDNRKVGNTNERLPAITLLPHHNIVTINTKLIILQPFTLAYTAHAT
jgi:hypothetical protein